MAMTEEFDFDGFRFSFDEVPKSGRNRRASSTKV